jgi:uncharacterized protein YjeT (DUF2065 family)
MNEAVVAVGLVLALEGALYALFPEMMKRTAAQVLQTPSDTLRTVGMVSSAAGVGARLAGTRLNAFVKRQSRGFAGITPQMGTLRMRERTPMTLAAVLRDRVHVACMARAAGRRACRVAALGRLRRPGNSHLWLSRILPLAARAAPQEAPPPDRARARTCR